MVRIESSYSENLMVDYGRNKNKDLQKSGYYARVLVAWLRKD
jgi:hypothetical protein